MRCEFSIIGHLAFEITLQNFSFAFLRDHAKAAKKCTTVKIRDIERYGV